MSKDEAWIESLYEEYYFDLFKMVRRLLPYCPPEDAHEIVQEVFLRASAKNIRNHPRPVGWLYITAQQLCKNKARKYKTQAAARAKMQAQHRASQPARMYDSSVPDETGAVDIMLTLESELSPGELDLFREVYLEGMTYEELSARTGKSTTYLKVLLYRIRKKAKSVLLACALILFIRHF